MVSYLQCYSVAELTKSGIISKFAPENKVKNSNTYLFIIDSLFGCLEKLVNDLLRFECDEAESFALVLRLVEWHFNFDDL